MNKFERALRMYVLIPQSVTPGYKHFLPPLLLLNLICAYERQQKYFHHFMRYTSMGMEPKAVNLTESTYKLITIMPFNLGAVSFTQKRIGQKRFTRIQIPENNGKSCRVRSIYLYI